MPNYKETLILSVETATRAGSIAVMRGERVLARRVGDAGISHSVHLLSDADAALRIADVRLDEIDLFVAVTGPGSFTGLRAGLATVKAFATTLDRAAVGIPTLHAIARMERGLNMERGHNIDHEAVSLLVLLPAGRGEVFAQLLAATNDDKIVELEPPTHLTPRAVFEKAQTVTSRLRWSGDGARQLADQIRERAQSLGLTFVEDEELEVNGTTRAADWILAAVTENSLAETLAEHAAILGLARFREGQSVRAEELKALYVRLSDAELKENVASQTYR